MRTKCTLSKNNENKFIGRKRDPTPAYSFHVNKEV